MLSAQPLFSSEPEPRHKAYQKNEGTGLEKEGHPVTVKSDGIIKYECSHVQRTQEPKLLKRPPLAKDGTKDWTISKRNIDYNGFKYIKYFLKS